MEIHLNEIIFLINPKAGKKNSQKLIDTLMKIDASISYYISESKDKLQDFFTSIEGKYKVIVLCGGDGTVNSILKYALNSKLIFAIYPMGSGDGFARELGYSKNLNQLIKSIQKGKTQEIDLVQINEQFSCNMIGLGLDSFIANRFEQSSKRGFMTYITETMKALATYKPVEIEIDINGETIKGKYFMANIANTRQFGNNAFIAPHAKPNDGLLELVLLKPLPLFLTPGFVLKLFSKTLKNSKYLQYIQAKDLIIKSNAEHYHIDGEPIQMPDSLHVYTDKKIRFISNS